MAWWIKNLWLFCSILLKLKKKNKACKVWHEILSMFACQHVNHLLKNQNRESSFKKNTITFSVTHQRSSTNILFSQNHICHRASFIFHRFVCHFCHWPLWAVGLKQLPRVFGRPGDWFRGVSNRGGKSFATRLWRRHQIFNGRPFSSTTHLRKKPCF